MTEDESKDCSYMLVNSNVVISWQTAVDIKYTHMYVLAIL